MAATIEANARSKNSRIRETTEEVVYEQWVHWPVNWTAVFVGALTALAVASIIGLIALAIGAHVVDAQNRMVDLKKTSLIALVIGVVGSFVAFVAGGWVAGKVAGILRSEPGMLHGAIVWLVAVPIMVIVAGMGAGSMMGGWYAGITSPKDNVVPYDRPEALAINATEMERTEYRAAVADYNAKVKQWREDTPKVTRNTALAAVTALLLGLAGSVVGGWMASGEPMNFTYYRTRKTMVPHSV